MTIAHLMLRKNLCAGAIDSDHKAAMLDQINALQERINNNIFLYVYTYTYTYYTFIIIHIMYLRTYIYTCLTLFNVGYTFVVGIVWHHNI